MPSTTPPRTAWLFSRGRDLVRLQIRDGDGRLQLVVSGPGRKHARYDFGDVLELIEYQATYERHLIALGYTLRELIVERPDSPAAAEWPRDRSTTRLDIS